MAGNGAMNPSECCKTPTLFSADVTMQCKSQFPNHSKGNLHENDSIAISNYKFNMNLHVFRSTQEMLYG